MKVELQTGKGPKIFLDNYEEEFNNGRWHTLVLSATTDLLTLSIDQRPMKTRRLLKITTGSLYLIGGKRNFQ